MSQTAPVSFPAQLFHVEHQTQTNRFVDDWLRAHQDEPLMMEDLTTGIRSIDPACELLGALAVHGNALAEL